MGRLGASRGETAGAWATGHTKGTGRVTRHRAPVAPAGRPSRRLSARRAPACSVLADSIVADAEIAETEPDTGSDIDIDIDIDDDIDDDATVSAASADEDHDDGGAIVVQDGPAHHSPTASRRRNRRQLTVTVLAACLVASLAGVFVNAVSTPQNPSVGVDETGFGVLLAEPPSDSAEVPRSLLDPPSIDKPAPAQQQGPAAGRVHPNGLGDALGQGVAALFGGSGSPWVERIATNAAIDPNSAEMVAGLASEKFQMSHKLWTVPLYYADKSTPRHDVPLTAGWQEGYLRNVPVPGDAEPDPSEDAHLAIVDRSSGCVYDFWGASRSGDGLTAKLGNAIPIDSDGAYAGGLGSRGSGFSAAAGIVTADELRKGSIGHALVFAYPKTRSGGPVGAATKSDGQSSGTDAIPEGAKVRLDPSIDLDSLGLNRYELIIAKAMQRYGMILGDTSGGFTIYSQHPQSLPAGAYDGLLPDDTWVDLTKIPTDKLQVLTLPQQKDSESGTVGNRCNGF